ncbi:MAG TPA: hypothetical protein VGR50_05270, partial [Terriglobales bacterium]|nr:hypothetical protein [Terriglobales bacterium]
SEVLEQVMQAVHANSSQNVLRLIDSLMAEGQSPVHFARQVVRFLRNATVAKVAGSDSPLLQTSADERQRIARVAELFSEEDLTRFLQIMLRSYNDISYRSDQRFHLELALLKLVHAQRLLPVEQILSGAGAAVSQPRPKPNVAPSAPDRVNQPLVSGATKPSPFEIDKARRSAEPEMSVTAVAVAVQTAPDASLHETAKTISIGTVRGAVLRALESGGHRMLASALDSGTWSVENGELLIKAHAAPSLLEMAVNAEARRVITSAASAAANRPLKLRIEGVPGANGKNAPSPTTSSGVPGSARERAADDPVVRRLQEKFGAEIRTVIDHREKRK